MTNAAKRAAIQAGFANFQISLETGRRLVQVPAFGEFNLALFQDGQALFQ
jgi:hypothetical protein